MAAITNKRMRGRKKIKKNKEGGVKHTTIHRASNYSK